ncbi:MAG: hypothetical protein KC502_19985, partial [Myxococcales bacterium]|nr:hypothetical protein [Myxococcales bacterium]
MSVLDRFKMLKNINLPNVQINISVGDPPPPDEGSYEYARIGTLPPYCAQPPACEQMPDATRSYIKRNLLRGKANELALGVAFRGQSGVAESVDDFGRLYAVLPRPP